MGNGNAQLTPRGELVADVLTALLFVGMGYAIVRAVAVVVVKIGQAWGVI
jgi:hypothetical protein